MVPRQSVKRTAGKTRVNGTSAINSWEAARSEQYRLKAETLLRVAASHFEERGYAGTSLNDICSELGITNNAVYHYFKSKEDIAYHCVLRGQQRLEEYVAEAQSAPADGLTKMETFIRLILQSAPEGPPLPIRLTYALTQSHRAEIFKRNEASRVALVGIVEEGISDRSIRQCDPRLTVDFLLAGTYAMHRRIKLEMSAAALPDVVDTIVHGISARD
jgi:TetR/AcrR family transcriptional regulator